MQSPTRTSFFFFCLLKLFFLRLNNKMSDFVDILLSEAECVCDHRGLSLSHCT